MDKEYYYQDFVVGVSMIIMVNLRSEFYIATKIFFHTMMWNILNVTNIYRWLWCYLTCQTDNSQSRDMLSITHRIMTW